MTSQLFPLPFKTHLIFGIICIIFFMFQYYRLKYRYELYMAIAVAMTFLLYVSDSNALFTAVGITEGVLMLLALISAQKIWLSQRREEKAEKAAAQLSASAPAEIAVEVQEDTDYDGFGGNVNE